MKQKTKAFLTKALVGVFALSFVSGFATVTKTPEAASAATEKVTEEVEIPEPTYKANITPYIEYALEHEIREENHVEEVYTLCGVDKDGKVTAIVTHYSENDEKENVQIKVDFGKYAQYDIYLLDKDYDGEWVKTISDLTFEMPVHSCIMIKEK